EQLVVDAEIVSICRRFLEGMTVNEETLALNVIADVGPRGNFMECSHTLDHLRAGALWEENLSNRFIYDTWKTNGSPDIMVQARVKVTSILDSHQPPILPEDVQSDMKEIIIEFEEAH
ncbi:unnamed protein product, partial [marine sediment metagenome]